MTVTVVDLALLRIAQHGIGLRGFLEPYGRLLVAGIAIRMILHGQYAVGFFQVLFTDRFGDTQDFIKAPLGGHSSPSVRGRLRAFGKKGSDPFEANRVFNVLAEY